MAVPTLWHAASGAVEEMDGGGLRLMEAALEAWECRTRRQYTGEEQGHVAIEIARHLLEVLRGVIAFDPRAVVGAEQLEGLFRDCSTQMIDATGRLPIGGAREILLPMLRAIAAQVGVEGDELRRMEREHGYPRGELTPCRRRFTLAVSSQPGAAPCATGSSAWCTSALAKDQVAAASALGALHNAARRSSTAAQASMPIAIQPRKAAVTATVS